MVDAKNDPVIDSRLTAAETSVTVSCEDCFSQRIIAVTRAVLMIRALRDRFSLLDSIEYRRIELSHLQCDACYRAYRIVHPEDIYMAVRLVFKRRSEPAVRLSPVVEACLAVAFSVSPRASYLPALIIVMLFTTGSARRRNIKADKAMKAVRKRDIEDR